MRGDKACMRSLVFAWGAAIGVATTLLSPAASALFIVNQPWLLPTSSGRSTEVYMNLTSTEGATLVAVRTDEATTALLRGQGKGTRTLEQLPLPAGTLVGLAPGKDRIALIKLKRPVKLGERVALTLTIEAPGGARQDIKVDAEARLRSPVDDERLHHAHPHPH